MPDSKIIPSLSGFYKMDFKQGSYRYGRSSFWDAGQNSFVQPPAQNEDQFALLCNTLPVVDGMLHTRWGNAAFGAAQTAPLRRFLPYYNDNTGVRAFMAVVPKNPTPYIYSFTESGTAYGSAINLPSGNSAAANNLYGVVSRNYLYMLDGQTADQLKWSGAASGGTSKWGIDAPATAVDVGAPVAGAVTVSAGRNYFAVFKNSVTGHVSDLNPVSASSGPLTSQQVPLTNIPQPSDPQVDTVVILATADGGSQLTLYALTSLATGVTTFNDNEPETNLLLLPVWQDTDSAGNTHGVADNTPPPTANGIVVSHRGRLYILDSGNLYFSKNLDDCTTATGTIVGRFEEAWPGTYQMAISKEAEVGTALFSDGITLYIGTTRTVRRLNGTGPSDFSEPETLYSEAGVANQDVWTRVFLAGQPVGVAWLTPDCRVIVSDFNSFEDVGAPVQDVLDSINRAAMGTACAAFIGNGPYDMYVLAIPTGSATTPNTLLVYDLRKKQWITWTNGGVNALLFDQPNAGAPIFVFADAAGGVWRYDASYTVDQSGGANIPIVCAVQASWQPLGDGSLRKSLNEFEIECSTPANMSVSIDGASTIADFSSPHAVVANSVPIASPFGPFKVYLAGSVTNDRYYRPTLGWTGPMVVGGWSFEAIPFNRL